MRKNKMQNKRNFLDYSWNLEYRLKNIGCAEELKNEILKYIELNKDRCTGRPMMVSNLIYISNLHYIEDNINKPGLLEEIRKLNNETNK